MYKNCLIIPVHIAGAGWLESLLASIHLEGSRTPDFCVALATSNEFETKYFHELLGRMLAGRPAWIIHTQVVDIGEYLIEGCPVRQFIRDYNDGHCEGIINIKKFAALHWACGNRMEFAACIDADAVATSNLFDLFSDLKYNYEAKQYFAGKTDSAFLNDIMRRSMDLFSPNDQRRLRGITRDGRLYPWFFDVPAYRMDEVSAFFLYMSRTRNGLSNWFGSLTWHTFEHIVFMCWRLLYGGAELIDYGFGIIPEDLIVSQVREIQQAHGYSPAWSRYRTDEARRPFTHFLYHVDRA
jgi:hypothetical protein